MPTFHFTSPEGKTYEITGPDGATQEQAFGMLQQQLGQKPQLAGTATPSGAGAAPPSAEPGLLEKAGGLLRHLVSDSGVTGALEEGAKAATGAVAKPISGLAGLASPITNALGLSHTAPADVVQNVQDALTYKPQSNAAQGFERGISEKVAPIASAVDKGLGTVGHAVGGDTGENLTRTIVPAALEAGLDIAGAKGAGNLLKAGAENAGGAIVEGAGKAPGASPIEAGRSAGFKFAPSDVASRAPAAAQGGEIPGLKREGLTGSSDIRKDLAQHNTAKATELAGEVIGKKGATTLTSADFDTARKPHFDTYKATGDAMGDKLSGTQDFQANLKNALASQDPKSALSPQVATQTQRILNAAQTGNMSGPQMVKDVSWLRANGGSSAKAVARMLEDEMDQQLAAKNAGPQLQAFREARTGLAQIKNLQDATKSGQIDLQALARLGQKNPKLLTGNLKIMADAAAAAPGSMRLPTGGVGSPIKADTFAGMAKQAAGKVVKKLVPGADVTSDAFQTKAFGREATPTERTYQSSVGKKPEAPSERFQLKPPEGRAFEPNQQGMVLPEGPPPKEQLDLTMAPGETGVRPVQLGMELAQGTGIPVRTRPASPSLGLPAPGQESMPGARVAPVQVTPEGSARLPDTVKDFVKDRAASAHPGIAKRASIGTILAKQDRNAQPSIGRQVLDRMDPDTAAAYLAALRGGNVKQALKDFTKQMKRGED